MLKLTIEIEEPPYEPAAPELGADNDVEDVMFSPDEEKNNQLDEELLTSPLYKGEDNEEEE